MEPLFLPGDQKVVAPQGDLSSASRRINWAYFALGIGAVGLGIAALVAGYIAVGSILTLVGLVVAGVVLKVEMSERQMVKRMRNRHPDHDPIKQQGV